MILDPKIIVALLAVLSNLLYFFNGKNRVVACFNAIVVVFSLIFLLSSLATNQVLFQSISIMLLLFLMTCVFVITIQRKSVKSKKDVKKNSFSFGYFLVVSLTVITLFLSVSYLLTTESVALNNDSNVETIDKIDVNNTALAKKKYESKISLFDERDLATKLLKGFSDLTLFICCLLPLMLCNFVPRVFKRRI